MFSRARHIVMSSHRGALCFTSLYLAFLQGYLPIEQCFFTLKHKVMMTNAGTGMYLEVRSKMNNDITFPFPNLCYIVLESDVA